MKKMKDPAEKARRVKKRSFVAAKLLVAVVLLCTIGYLGASTLMDNSVFETTFYHIYSKKLTSVIRTVVLADLHSAEFGEGNQDMVDAIASLNPDFISIVGDMINYQDADWEGLTRLCEKLVAIAPTYYVMGNNELDELYYNGVDVRGIVEATGAILLHDQIVEIKVKGNPIVIGGLTRKGDLIAKDAPNFLDDLKSREGFRVLLTHYPENFSGSIPQEAYDAAFAGHAHGGTIRLPFVGALYSPDQGFLPKWTEGLRTFGTSSLVISRGLGNNHAIPRMNNTPELIVVDFEKLPGV